MLKKIIATASAVFIIAGCMAGCANANTVHSSKDLEDKTIGVQLGTTGEILAADIPGAKIEKYNSGEDAVKNLREGNIDAVIIDSDPARVYAENNDDIQVLDDILAKEDYAIAVALDNSALQGEINSALAELKSDGTIDRIIGNYIGSDKGNSPYTSPAGIDRSKGTLTMATNAEFPPYESLDTETVVGIDADIMQAICDKLGYQLKIKDMAFSAVLSAVESGEADVAMSGITVTEERKKQVLFCDPYTTSTQVIITRKD